MAASPDDRTKTYLERATGSWFLTTFDEKPRASAEPSWGDFEWPLRVGKTWVARYQYNDHVGGRSWSGSEQSWRVEATETITVPAGTFETFRLRSAPGRNVSIITTRWYAPALGLYVKQRTERTAGHYQGAGWSSVELTEYKRPSD